MYFVSKYSYNFVAKQDALIRLYVIIGHSDIPIYKFETEEKGRM
jgi:hypothetical protein